MKQSAVEWLIDELMPSIALQTKYIEELKEQAKEMEKQMIIDILDKREDYLGTQPSIFDYLTNKEWFETYGNKGSDEHIVDTNKMIYPKTAFEILQPKLTIADTLEFREKHIPEILNAMEEYATSSQTEISDDEIWQVGDIYANQNTINDDNDLAYFKGQLSGFFEGAKWYREQLKSRQ